MGTIEIKKVERKVIVGNLYRGRCHRCDHQAEDLHAGDAGRWL